MSRNLTRVLMAVLVLNAIAVASTMLTNASATTSVDPAPHSTANSAAVVETADFDYLFSTVTAAPYRIDTPAAAAVDFDNVFASVSTPHRMNTPPNRERLRNIGWRRILGS
jgi:hypothetical protein